MKALAALPCGAASLVGFGVGVELVSLGSSPPQPAASSGSTAREDDGQPRAHGARSPIGAYAASSSRGTSSTVRVVPSRTTSSSQRTPIRSSVISRWRSSTPRTGSPVDADDQVLGVQPGAGGGRAVDHLDHLDRAVAPERGGDARRQRSCAAGDADPGAPHAAVAHQRGHDPARGGVDGDGQAEADPATAVLIPTTLPRPSTSAPPELPGLSAASVWMTSSMMRVAPPGAGGQRPAERRHHAGRHRARVAVRVADRDHELADPQRGRVAELGRLQPRRLGPQDREVRQRVGADDRRLQVAAVGERRAYARARARDHVGAGEHEAVGVITTPDPPPVFQRRRFEIRRFATDGPSVSATRVTTCEYASSASRSPGAEPGAEGRVSVVTCKMLATAVRGSALATPRG